jgi:hypothetical protein
MKHDVMPSIVQMEKEVLKNLTKEVKETLATDVVLPKATKPSFGVADLWNIRRNARSAQGRMRTGI